MEPEFLAFVAVQYVCLLFSLCVHEAAHAWTAERCGDPSARLLGRVTLNPLAHIDPIGTVVMPLLMMTTGIPYLFGWAKPVPFNPLNLRNKRRDPVLIAVAGPFSNLLIAITSILVLRAAFAFVGSENLGVVIDSPLFLLANFLISINIILMLFNLIPCPPLDGGHVLYYFLPESGKRVFEQIGPFGILIAILVASRFLGTPLRMLRDAADWLLTAGIA